MSTYSSAPSVSWAGNSPHPTSVEEEEALVVALFRGAVDVAAAAAAAPDRDKERQDKRDEDQAAATSGAAAGSSSAAPEPRAAPEPAAAPAAPTSTTASTAPTPATATIDSRLLQAEQTFLDTARVLPEGVRLEDVASRFKRHKMPAGQPTERGTAVSYTHLTLPTN